ncbi:MAG: DinB family protein [Bacteroidota bacterium]
MKEVNNILSLLRKTYEKDAWHGQAVKEVLEGITPDMALKKLSNTHSIIELVAHMTTWRIYVTRKLEGDPNFHVSDEMNFPKVSDWKKAVSDLDNSQAELIKAIEKFPEQRLHEQVPHTKNKYTFYTLLHGIVHHDLYHLGQIALLKKV